VTTEAARRLEVHNVTKTFGGTKVLSGLSLVVDAGEIHGLVGENGSGKSTLVKILTGYHTCNSDAVIAVDGRRVGVRCAGRRSTRPASRWSTRTSA